MKAFILILFPITLISQNWFEPNTKITYQTNNLHSLDPFSAVEHYETFEYDRDTIIDNKNYKVVKSFKQAGVLAEYNDDGQTFDNTRLIFREQDKKIFVRKDFSEIKIYDFNLTAGESYFISDAYFNIECTAPIELRIDSVGSINFAGKLRNTQYVTLIDTNYNQTFINNSIFIEGIGAVGSRNEKFNLIENIYCGPPDIYTHLCLIEDQNANYTFYTNQDPEMCFTYIIANTDEIDLSMTKLYPNPAYSKINISSTLNPNSIKILDQFGRSLIESKNTTQINIQYLNPGIYIVQIEYNGFTESKIFTKK